MAAISFIKPEINFKRVSGGWVFRAPNPWIFGESPHYLVSDDQKVQITAVLALLRPMLRTAMVLYVLCWAAAAVWWVASSDRATPDLVYMFFIFMLLLVGIPCLAEIQRRRLKPILADAAPTNERITYAEMRKAHENSTTPEQARWHHERSVLACVCLALVAILNPMSMRPGIFLPILLTFASLYYGWEAVRWYRVTKRQPKQEQ